ncbi:hypothetical protein GCM10008018_50680 [Paenibacillus marchantiophytorum]|uniref:Lipoprotein n=1 Tax=Paenibacillus marchantiophytorum TaxID=1619310 RepID=A0ABQ1F2U4_9BACL|nr:hypothetical protein [Paenibacillus marchantiophytorum]GFZ98300.1 hypothetical protein GCM10008018_50680 [Paenibacillus marchantiophytorum]
MKKLLIGSIVLLIVLSGCTSAKYKQSIEAGNKALVDKKYAEAVTAFSTAVAEEPKNAEAKQKLDDAKIKQDEEIKAKEEAEKKAKEEAEKKEKDAVSKYVTSIKETTNQLLTINTNWDQLRKASASGEVDNATFGKLVSDKFIPAATTLVEKIQKVSAPSEEIRLIHELYISSAEKQQQAFTEIVAAINSGDMSKITKANQLLTDAQKSERDYVAKLKPILDKYKLSIE